jgi:hypothetical protein
MDCRVKPGNDERGAVRISLPLNPGYACVSFFGANAARPAPMRK